MANFVGREREQRAFAELLAAGEAPRIVFLHGPGGIGKSHLLDAFHSAAERSGVDFAKLDARLLPAEPGAVAGTVEQALAGLETPPDGRELRVLALDHAEQLSGLDGWLRAELIPGLPQGIVLVLASRRRPGPEWRADPGLNELLLDYELAPLAPWAVSRYLELRGIRGAQRASVRDFARGHPLALALAADQVQREPDREFDCSECPDLIHGLVRWLLRDLDDPARLHTLAACATVRVLNEPLLAAMLGRDDVRDGLDWLADRHFVEQQPAGLVVHDLVRDVIVRDLRGRDPTRHHELIRRATAHLLEGLETSGRYGMLQAVADSIYALRYEPHVQRQFPFGEERCYPDAAKPEEIPALVSEVERLEGGESARWLEWWLKDGATELMVMRNSAREPVALALVLSFAADDVDHGSPDPGVHALFRHLRRHAPLRGGERALLVRFLLAHGSHQARTPVWAELVGQLNGLIFRPGVDVVGWAVELAYDWSRLAEYSDSWLLPNSEYDIGGRHYAICGHDSRREPPLEWARNCVERILRDGDAPELRPSPVVLLNRAEFEAAVLEALHEFNDDGALARSPLLRSPMLRRYAARRDVDTLRALIRETSAAQLADPRPPATLHEVLEHTRFSCTAIKQHAVAVALHMSERTLRRRLREAEARLVEALWRLETGADEPR